MKDNILLDKTFTFAVRVVNAYKHLVKEHREFVLSKQFLRSGTSIGANSEEAVGGQSRNDFAAKLSIAYKEAREAAYWLRLIQEAALIPADRLGDAIDETEQLIKILSSILLHTKQGIPN